MKHSLSSVMWGGIAVLMLLCAPLAAFASEVVASVPGNTVVQDPAGDLLLRDCDQTQANLPCSLPPGAPLALPGYFDVKTAMITQAGSKVDLHIELYAPIPAAPPETRVIYFWQFQDGCLPAGSPTDKDGIHVVSDGDTQTWSANWFVITSCNPRTSVQGDPVPFTFTDAGVKVRVSLSDLLANETSPGSPLSWYAGVRRLPFEHPVFTHTVPVDLAPDVTAFNPTPSPIIIHPEDPATWDPR